MKVGVLTFHRATNYGTALQAYATVRALKNMGIEAELIDYRPEYIERTIRQRKIRDARSVKSVASILLNRMVYGGQMQKKISRFQNFISAMPVSSAKCETLQQVEAVSRQYDVIVSGSDQLWNEKITGDDRMYFLPFSHPGKITYASSFGVDHISNQRKADILPYLYDFQGISVREKTAQKMLAELMTDVKKAPPVYRVADPTLLLSKEQWLKEIEPQVRLPENGYILTYYMIETPILREITSKLKRETGLPVVNIKPSKRQMLLHEGINMMWAGPREFLSCYANAKFVVTNSFHGTAFSINFDIPMFISPLPASMAGEVNSRLVDILQWYGLSDRWIDSPDAVHGVHAGDLPPGLSDDKERRKAASLAILRQMIGSDVQ